MDPLDERGRPAISAPLLFLIAQVLGDIKGHGIRMSELLEGSDSVELTSATDVSAEYLRNAVNGDALDLGIHRRSTRAGSEAIAPTGVGLAEERAARRLGVSPEDVSAPASALWGTSLTAHRDALAGQNANGQTRGRITRRLVDQIRERADTGSSSIP